MRACARVLLASMLLLAGPAGVHAAAEAAGPGYSFAALYNLGNAYARAGKPGMAVLNYERASLLAPGDPDVEANLLAVRRASGVPADPRSWPQRTVGAVNPTVAAWIGVIGLALVAASWSVGPLLLPQRWARRAALIAGAALFSVPVGNGVMLWPRLHEAIVLVGAAPLRVSPAPLGEALSALKEAETVRVAGEHEGFVLVRTAGGRTGWVWHTDLAPVVPRR